MPSNKKVELKFKEYQSILYIVIDIKQISIAVKLAKKTNWNNTEFRDNVTITYLYIVFDL